MSLKNIELSATNIIIGLNVLLFLVVFITGGFTGQNLFRWGAMYGGSGLSLRLFSSMFLHSGVMHLLFNMYALYFLGNTIESVIGKYQFIFLYLGAGLIGSLIVAYFSSATTLTVGASGAIFGLFAYMIFSSAIDRSISSHYIGIVALNMFISFTSPGISILGHLGGFIGGFIMTYILRL